MKKSLLLIAALYLSITTIAQTSSRQFITTAWGNYVSTNISGYGNTLLQVSVDGQNSVWHGVFSINGTNSHTPDITWNNVKLISFSGYNAVVDDVKALIMSNTPTTSFGGTTIVLKIEPRTSGSASLTVVATGLNVSTLSLSHNSTSPPFAHTMANSAGTYNMWTVNNNVGIGTSSPRTRLDLGELRLGIIPSFPSEGSILEGDWANYIIGSINNTDLHKLRLGVSNDLYTRAEICLYNSNGPDGTIALKTANGSGGAQTRMFINGNGNVGIGTESIDNAAYKLYVETGIRTRKVKVDIATWPDYVFHASYRLRPLSEVAQYIQQHHHLPEVPSAAEVKRDGLDLGDNQATLLKKIEELTIYLIEQNGKLEEINNMLQKQIKINNDQQRDIEVLRKQKLAGKQ